MALRTDREKTAHLLRRFGLGASEAELAYYAEGGLERAVDRLLDYDKVDEGFAVDIRRLGNQQQRFPNMPFVQAWWMLRMLATRRPLQEKMTLFWHDHFATSAAKVNSPPANYNQNELLRKHATGNFREFVLAISRDPAMIFWLDNQYNVAGKPNENYARELMELFTLGIGHYTEEDVAEVARAFTGWSYGPNARRRIGDRQPLNDGFVFREFDHDAGEKTVRGKKGDWNGDDVVKMLCDDPQTARHIAKKLWEWFAFENPEPKLVERLAKVFRDSDLEIKPLLKAIMAAPEFYSDRAERQIVKNPVDFVVPTMRQLGVGQALMSRMEALGPEAEIPRNLMIPVIALQQAAKNMGMTVFYPPDVSGWEHGNAWITSATMVQRIAWADTLFAPREPGRPVVRGRPNLALPVIGLVSDPTPEGLVGRLASLFDAPLPKDKIAQITDVVWHETLGTVTPRNANSAAAAACRLIFGSPEFQLA
ncbi:MAG: DUF1800 domain-containing protein [Fimbriimonadaceae bacterium]|nr:DUF1800 domain-containing protein [Fimbriimonadaceae bacterium]